jgi:diketogulonate reductase-like aldo/keto reductase
MGLAQAWRDMEKVQAEGKTRSIGVSNYRIDDLEETLKTANVSSDSAPF